MTEQTSGPRLAIDNLLTPVVGVTLVGLLGSDGGLVLCPFRRMTEGYCPLCGGTRAAARLVSGDVEGAWGHHPLVVLMAIQLPLLAVWVWQRTTSNANDEAQHQRWTVIERWVAANLALAVGIWMWRLGIDAIPRPTTVQSPLTANVALVGTR